MILAQIEATGLRGFVNLFHAAYIEIFERQDDK